MTEAAGTDITDASDLLDLDQNAEETIPEMSVGRKQEQRRYKSELQIVGSNKEQWPKWSSNITEKGNETKARKEEAMSEWT